MTKSWHRHRHAARYASPRAGWLFMRSLRRRIFFLLAWSVFFTAIVVSTLFRFMAPHRAYGPHPGSVLMPLLVCAAILWAASGWLAFRLSRPYSELARVAKDIGAGRLGARFELGHNLRDRESRLLSEAINDMAARIEKQLADQRELLAAVSHEIRTPLGRIRLIAELLRGQAGELTGPQQKALDDLDREVVEIDALVGQLLASSRVDFAALQLHDLDAADVAKTALERAGLAASLLRVEAPQPGVTADPTLVARALANLIDNAIGHGGGVDALVVREGDGGVVFEVLDRGPGFEPGDETRVFEPFYQRPGAKTKDRGSLGLGLSLVARIATAHAGSAFAANRDGGGARVGFVVPRTGTSAE